MRAFITLLALALLACGSSPFPITLDLEPTSMPLLETCDDAAFPDSLTVTGAEVHGRTLLVQYESGGGCETHEYAACFVDAVLSSEPPQFELRILHNKNGDACRSFETQVLSVELPNDSYTVSGLRRASVLLQ